MTLVSATDTCNDDLACITMASHDRIGLEAIRSLHSKLDDDANGNVDLSESDDVRIFIYIYIIHISLYRNFFLYLIHMTLQDKCIFNFNSF